jgi:hypothetical protein
VAVRQSFPGLVAVDTITTVVIEDHGKEGALRSEVGAARLEPTTSAG